MFFAPSFLELKGIPSPLRDGLTEILVKSFSEFIGHIGEVTRIPAPFFAMTKIERAKLLRTRFRAVGGIAYVGRGEQRAAPAIPPKPPKIYLQWPQCEGNTARAPKWMLERDGNGGAKLIPKANRRGPEKSTLTRIAEKMPGKLPRVNWENPKRK